MSKHKCKVNPIEARALKASQRSKNASQTKNVNRKRKAIACQELNTSDELSNYFNLIKQTLITEGV